MSPGAQNIKTGPKPSIPLKMSLGAQNMKTGPDAPGTVENESQSTKLENMIWRPRYNRKRIREHKILTLDLTSSVPTKTCLGVQNMQTGPDVLGIVKNESGIAKYKNGTQLPRYRTKRVRERKT
jgi:hypothetical protein